MCAWTAPDTPHKLRIGNHSPVTLDQNAEQLPLPLRELHLLPVPANTTPGDVHLEPLPSQDPTAADAARF